ncbi:uncharacterized protein LOC115970955 isoform X2 [Quercus lobata]|uniref:uncharacterized protein LOC115970955 isoform X2 n=1 Tax=Quercus lobata TaxID=97700 RepID=UPI0012467EBA|nr:uncharacterized protein LOC115970955 isoform X2 [Quercus lobata]
MVARNSSDWLPSGWTVDLKVQKSGREIRSYKNLETGQKFFSKEDVLNYIKSRRSDSGKPQPTNRRIKRHSKVSSKTIVVKTNEHPDWLPNDWNVEVRTRHSGSKIGAKYKCYIDPLAGCRFYSKPEVLRYLKTIKRKTSTSNKRKTDNGISSVAVEKHKVEDLPRGWIKEIKIKKNAHGIRRDPPSSAAKRQKLNHPATRRRLFAGKGSSALSLEGKGTSALSKKGKGTSALSKKGKGSSDKSSLEAAEGKSTNRGQGNKVSAEQEDAFAPTTQIVQDKNLIGNTNEFAEIKENSNPGRSALPKANGSQRKGQPESLPAKSEPVLTPTANTLQEKNGFENVKEKRSTRKNLINSSKSRKKKEFNLPFRSSKRLAGLEPEQIVNSVSSHQAFQVSSTNFGESGTSPDACLATNSLSNEASQQFKDEQGTMNAPQSSLDMNDGLHGEPSEKSKEPHKKNQAANIEQLEMLETEKVDEEKLEEQCCLVENSWSDPCLEFAIKTLTGALPLESTSNDGHVLMPSADIPQIENSLEDGIKKSSNRKTQVNLKKSMNKKELNLPCRSSKRVSGFELEIMANTISSEQALQNTSRENCESEATVPLVLADGASQQLEAGLHMEFSHHASTIIDTPLLGDSSNKSEKPPAVEVQVVPEEQLQLPETEIMPEPQELPFPFSDSWSDPCLEFAFKTLTGAIPVEDNLAQGYFQEELDISHTRRDSGLALPDFGSHNFFQNDITSHFDLPEKSETGHQPSMSSSLSTPGTVSLPSCSGIGSQPCLEGKKDLHGKVNS